MRSRFGSRGRSPYLTDGLVVVQFQRIWDSLWKTYQIAATGKAIIRKISTKKRIGTRSSSFLLGGSGELLIVRKIAPN